MKRLHDQVAIITGAGSGMGRSIAMLYAHEGAKTIVSDVNTERASRVVEEIIALGGSAKAIVANVTKEADVQQLVDETIKAHGTIDILVNNAGIMDNFMSAESVTDEMWEKVLSVNTTGSMRTIRKVLPIFRDKKKGTIINIASVGGLQGSRAGLAYTASKYALIGLTKNVAFQYAGLGIRCNAIAPGAVNTNIGDTIREPDSFGMERAMIGSSINPRVGEAEEIAKVALFLASEEASFVNGTVIIADAGWTAY